MDYLQNDEDLVSNNQLHNTSTPSPNHQTGFNNHLTRETTTQSRAEKFCYTCTVCREVLSDSQELLRHVRTHTRLKTFNCSDNHKVLHPHRRSFEDELNPNLFFQNSQNGPKCCLCHKRFSDSKMLSQHEKAQHKPPFKCRYCSSMFSLLKLYKIHLNFHLKQQQRIRVPDRKIQHNNKQWNKSGAYSVTANAYRPSVQTSNEGLLMQHNFPKHQMNYANPQFMRCKYCNKQFQKASSLRKHETLHENHQGKSNSYNQPDFELAEARKRSISRSSNEFSHMNPSSINKTLTLTPSLLSNLNKLANLNSTDTRDGKKPAILININTNDSMKEECQSKSQELPVGSSASGLMISSVSSAEKKYYEKTDKSAPTVTIQNGKKAISLADLQCPICKKIVSQPFSLKIHLRTHTMER